MPKRIDLLPCERWRLGVLPVSWGIITFIPDLIRLGHFFLPREMLLWLLLLCVVEWWNWWLFQAVCCSDGVHCCPNDYRCDTQRNECVRSESDALPFLFNDLDQFAFTDNKRKMKPVVWLVHSTANQSLTLWCALPSLTQDCFLSKHRSIYNSIVLLTMCCLSLSLQVAKIMFNLIRINAFCVLIVSVLNIIQVFYTSAINWGIKLFTNFK